MPVDQPLLAVAVEGPGRGERSPATGGGRSTSRARRVAIVAQSGGIGFAIKHRAKALGVAISYCVSAGNESDLGAGEFLDYMVQDASTDVILLFIEGIRDVDKFLAAARAPRRCESPSSSQRSAAPAPASAPRLPHRQHGRMVGGL